MDYDSTTTDSNPLRHTPLTIVILVIAYSTVLVGGLLGNGFVILVVGKMAKMKAATKYFMLNLAAADLLVLIFCPVPSLISNIYIPWKLGSLMCKVVPYIQGVSVCASSYSLAAISADRLMAVGFGLRRQITATLARRIIVLIWMWAAGLALPWLLYFDLSNENGREPSSLVFCTESWPFQISGNIYFVLVNLGLFYLFPLSFICFCHLIVWLRVRSPRLQTNASLSQRQIRHRKANDSVQKLVVAVVVCFAASWLPLYAIFVRVKLIPVVLGPTEGKVLDYAVPIAQWLGAANSCINPILYALFNRNFRLPLRKLLGGLSACPASRTRPNTRHKNPLNQGDGLRPPHFVRLRVVLQRCHRKRGQLKNTRRSAVRFRKSSVPMLHHKSQESAGIARSLTYKAAMGNPWQIWDQMKPAHV